MPRLTCLACTRVAVLCLLRAVGCLALSAACAQAKTCEQVQQDIATGIESSGVSSYWLEILPRSRAAPSGAKVVGTCEGGARKIWYRRHGMPAALAKQDEPRAAWPAVTPAPVPAAPEPIPKVQAEAVPAQLPAPAAPLPVAAPALLSVAAPAPASVPTPTPTPVLAPASTPAAEPVPVPMQTLAAPPSPMPVDHLNAAAPERADFLGRHWPWLVPATLLLLLGGGWLVRRHAYDGAGLPRGPKL